MNLRSFSTPENNPIFYPTTQSKKIARPIFLSSYHFDNPQICNYMKSKNILIIDDHIPTEDIVKKPYNDPLDLSYLDMYSDERKSFHRQYFYRYEGQENVCPLNPKGATGLRGKGLLSRWGVNHKIELIISRYVRNENENFQSNSLEIEILLMKNVDNQKWLLPGIFEQYDRILNKSIINLFQTTISSNLIPSDHDDFEKNKKILNDLLINNAEIIYQGYLDDPRNT
ncbi:unnamed protein product, partial [Brachionus calyciflorus]